jgi:hypothetical protein
MTRIFARPNAAFFAYERSLMRPRSRPPTKHDVPTLWERAKAMYAVVLEAVGSAATLAQRYLVTRRERRHILARLIPIEKIVRTLLMIEAATFLLMTPEGRRLREETPKIEPPAPPPPVGVAKPKPTHYTQVLMPGWHTIAANHPRIDPRVVEREAREALERRLTEFETLTSEASIADPAAWSCRFNVVHWVHPEPDDTPAAPPQLARLPQIITFSDTNYPIVPGMIPPRPAPREPAAQAEHDNGGMDLARRIEALSRILANPAPAIRRLARRLAALPADALCAPEMARLVDKRWHHGNPENWNACLLTARPFRALAWLVDWSARKHEPG